IAADASDPGMPMDRAWGLAAAAAAAIAAIVFFVTIGPRPDIAAAAETARFLFKPVVTGVLAATAFLALSALSRPASNGRPAMLRLAAAPAILAAAVMLELFAVPPDEWSTKLVGSNAMVCLTYIPLI